MDPELTLEESVKAYEEGTRALKEAQRILEEAKLQFENYQPIPPGDGESS